MLLHITVYTIADISNCGNIYIGLLTKIVPLPDLGVSLPWVSNVRQPFFLCFVDRASRYNRVKRNQLYAQPILRIFRQPLYVSGVSRPIIRRYNRMYTAISTYYSF